MLAEATAESVVALGILHHERNGQRATVRTPARLLQRLRALRDPLWCRAERPELEICVADAVAFYAHRETAAVRRGLEIVVATRRAEALRRAARQIVERELCGRQPGVVVRRQLERQHQTAGAGEARLAERGQLDAPRLAALEEHQLARRVLRLEHHQQTPRSVEAKPVRRIVGRDVRAGEERNQCGRAAYRSREPEFTLRDASHAACSKTQGCERHSCGAGVARARTAADARPGDGRQRALRHGAAVSSYARMRAVSHAGAVRTEVSMHGSVGQSGVSRIVGRSAAMQRVRERVAALARLSVPVLVRGEEGSGRSHVIGVLRELRGEAGRELLLLRSGDRRLLAPVDSRRSLVLDEVARLSQVEQARWRDALPAAGREAAVTLYATTTEDLALLARRESFDPLLAETLGRFTIALPALRDRREDLPELGAELAQRACARLGREPVALSRAALRLLQAHSWPGNVRELAFQIERLVAFSIGPRIERSHVEALFEESPRSVVATRRARSSRQREELQRLIDETGGNLAEVARRLEMSRGGVIYRAQKFGLMRRSI